MAPRLRSVVQTLASRMSIRTVFLALFLVAVVQLLRFEQWARGEGPYVSRPESVAGLLPVGHFLSFFTWLRGGGWDLLLPAGLVIILAAVAVSLLFKRGFCGWICPLGTLWEWAALAGRRLLGGRHIRVPSWLDRAGRGFRWLVAAAAVFVLLSVSMEEALAFRELPYMWVADLKILQQFEKPLMWSLMGLAFVLSMVFGPVWCRWLCPLGGIYSVVGMASPCAVRRDPELCTACGACAETCHAFVDVRRSTTVRDSECDGCMECVRVCPTEGCLDGRVLGSARIPPYIWAALVVGTWLGIYAIAELTGGWNSTIPDETFRQVINSGLLDQRTPGGF